MHRDAALSLRSVVESKLLQSNRSEEGFEQLGRFDVEPAREGNDIQQRYVALASLHSTHVIAMQIR
jgi:hypothetical protein